LNQFVCQISFSFLLQTLETHPSESFANYLIALKDEHVYRSSRKVNKWKTNGNLSIPVEIDPLI
jgi:hypothetical protein